MVWTDIVPYHSSQTPKVELSKAVRISPILVDFFWIEDVIKIEKMLIDWNPKSFWSELNLYFRRNPNKEWTYFEIRQMLEELANILMSNTGNIKRRVQLAVNKLTWYSTREQQLIEIIYQFRSYYYLRSNRHERMPWYLVADINQEVIDMLEVCRGSR